MEFHDHPSAATWFSDHWIDSHVEQQWSWWRPEAPRRGVLGAVELRHADRGAVESAARRLRQVVAIAPQSRLVAAPTVVDDEKAWPTSVPADWIEWAIDVRPVRDWID